MQNVKSARGQFALFSIDGKLGNQQNGWMKTTLDLPGPLIKKVKLHALHRGQKLKDTVADLLRKGLSVGHTPSTPVASPGVKTDPKTGLPFFPSAPNAPTSKMRTEQIYALIQQTQEEEDLERSGLSL